MLFTQTLFRHGGSNTKYSHTKQDIKHKTTPQPLVVVAYLPRAVLPEVNAFIYSLVHSFIHSFCCWKRWKRLL